MSIKVTVEIDRDMSTRTSTEIGVYVEGIDRPVYLTFSSRDMARGDRAGRVNRYREIVVGEYADLGDLVIALARAEVETMPRSHVGLQYLSEIAEALKGR